MKKINYDFFNTQNRTQRMQINHFAQKLELKKDKNTQKTQGETSVLEAHKEEFKDMPKEFFDAVKTFEKNGYKLDKSDLNELKNLFKQGEIRAETMDMSIKKSLPINSEILGEINGFIDLSLLDFLDLKEEYNGSKRGQIRREHPRQHSGNDVNSITQSIDKALNEMMEQIEKEEEKTPKYKLSHQEQKENPNIKKNIDDSDFLEAIEELKTHINNQNQEINASLFTQNYDFKLILEEKITPKITSVKTEFEALKTHISKNIEQMMQTPNAKNNADLLFKTIETLDNAIMKSDISLYMDLKGERDLIKLSTKLNQAHDILQKGDYSKARNMLTEISQDLNDIVFKPSLKKIMAISNIPTPTDSNLNLDYAGEFMSHAINSFHEEVSASSLLDFMRTLGINHESEVFQKLFPQINQSSENRVLQEQNNQIRNNLFNLKEILLNLSKSSENISMGEKVKANSAISAINVNQYQNKFAEEKIMQEMNFHIPVKINNKVADVKVFIKSSQKNMKLDYANFNMYFVLNTELQGDIGIRVSAVDLKLKVELKNDVFASKPTQKLEKIRGNFKTFVEEIGYHLVELKFSKFDEEKNSSTNSQEKNEKPEQLFYKNTFNLKV